MLISRLGKWVLCIRVVELYLLCWSSTCFVGNLFALLSRLGQTDRDRLLAALHFATLAAPSALCRAAIVAPHFAFDRLGGTLVNISSSFLPSFVSQTYIK